MDKLIEKAKNSKWWKWLFALLIVLGAAFLLWMIRRKNNQLKKLRVEKQLADEIAKDLAAQAQVEKNEGLAKALREEAERAVTRAAEVDTQIKYLESQVTEAKKKVNDAKSWKELEK